MGWGEGHQSLSYGAPRDDACRTGNPLPCSLKRSPGLGGRGPWLVPPLLCDPGLLSFPSLCLRVRPGAVWSSLWPQGSWSFLQYVFVEQLLWSGTRLGSGDTLVEKLEGFLAQRGSHAGVCCGRHRRP